MFEDRKEHVVRWNSFGEAQPGETGTQDAKPKKRKKKKKKKTFSCKFSVYGASDASTSSYRGGISANFDLSKCVPACIDLKNPFLLRTA